MNKAISRLQWGILLGLATASAFGWAWAATAQQITFRLPENDPNLNSNVIRSAAFSPDGTLLGAGYGRFIGLLQEPRPGQAVLWEVRTRKRGATISARLDGVCSVTFSPDGKSLALAEYPGIIRLWDVPSNRERLTIKAPAWTAGTIAFSPDGKWLAAGLWTGTKDGVSPPGNDVMLWDAATGKTVRTLKGHTEAVRDVAFSPDGRLLVSAGWDGLAKVRETTSGRARATLAFPAIRERATLAFSTFRKRGEKASIGVESFVFSPDGRTFITAAGISSAPGKPDGVGQVNVWDATTDQLKTTLKGYDGLVRQLAFSPNGKLLATAGSDELIGLWDTATLRKIGEIKGGWPIAFSPDGRELVLSVDERTLAPRNVSDAVRR